MKTFTKKEGFLMNRFEFENMMKATFRGVVIRPKLDGCRPNFYIPSIRTIVLYEDRKYSDAEIMCMKYEIFNLTIDEWGNERLYERVKPKDYIKHIRIRKGEEYKAIADIMINSEDNIISYTSTLRLREKDREDNHFDINIKNRLVWR